ncbi:Receptor expression-enhancing protein 5 [Borealophlyctis nickersoniae]|nr:Receptor expression-enhancing protein 5 [Borealophlyctis nickersoniae]
MSTPADSVTPSGSNTFPATNALNRFVNTLDASSPAALRPAIAYLRAKPLPYIALAERKAHSNPILISIWHNAGVPPVTFAVLALVAVLASVRRMLKRSPLLLSNLVGVVYPAYSSIKAVERPQADDDERWLTYWSIYGLFTILDTSATSILKRIPYFVPKMAILYWLFGRDGSLVMYRKVIRPFLVRYGGYGTVLNVPASSVSGSSTPLAIATPVPKKRDVMIVENPILKEAEPYAVDGAVPGQ